MKKSTILKSALAIVTGLFIAGKAAAQNVHPGFEGWAVSIHTGTASTSGTISWDGPVTVSMVSNLNLPGGTLLLVPGRFCTMPDTTSKKTSASFGMQLGYSRVFNHILASAEVGLSSNSYKASQTSIFYPESIIQARNPLTFERTISVGVSKTLTLRTGYVKGKHLVYAMAGVSFTPVTMKVNDDYKLSGQAVHAASPTASANGYTYTSVTHEQRETKHIVGLSVGAGYQYMVADGVRLGIEYRGTAYGRSAFTIDKVTGEQPIGGDGKKYGIGGEIGAHTVFAGIKQQSLTVRVDISFSAIAELFKH